jgi:alginate O-acetyltransferase complex protein AlgI
MGASIVIENRLSNSKMLKATGIIYTFLLTTVFAVFLSCGSLEDSFRYILAMLGGNHSLADMQTLYLIKSYLVLFIIMMYASTDLFRNILVRSGRNRIKKVINAAAPAAGLLVLMVCTALMAYSGSSDMILLKL